MPQPPVIAIIGGGPAGLVAANILHRYGWPVTVFEADAAPSARDQGGTLDLHPDNGQLALAKAGLLDAFLSTARHEDQEERVRDHATGALLREVIPDAGTGERPEIDRLHLRQLLLQPLGNEVVRWGERVEEVVAHPDGRHNLRLRERTVGPFDLVIGADGAWSRVRPALSDVRPAYTGVTFVELWLSEVDERHPALAKLVGHGTMFSLHNEAGIFAQRNGEATIRVCAAFRTLAEDTDRPDKALAGITTAEILARFEGWSPSLLALIVEADRIAAIRPIVALPAGFRWEHRCGLTLVGDAAHVMPPMGEGVNLAMLDAAELAEALVGAGDWRQAAEACETAMIERASEVARECHRGFAEWREDPS
jgi:2-polyprenyl-6-methoxyphenol hydroxylase-like FAD-dependent oxidoreductase